MLDKFPLLIIIFLANFLYALNVRLSPTSYDFGIVTIDTYVSYQFELRNISSFPIHICSVHLLSSQNAFSLSENNCEEKTLKTSETCTEKITFHPTEKLKYIGRIIFVYDDDGDANKCNSKKTQEAVVSGTGTSLRVVKTYPEPVYQGTAFSVISESYIDRKKLILRLCNAGGENIILSSKAITLKNLDNSAFGITYSSCDNATLIYYPNNENCSTNYCEIEIIFDPSANDNFNQRIYRSLIFINDLNAGPQGQRSNISIYLEGRLNNVKDEIIYATPGSMASKIINLNFTCPDNGNSTPGETIDLGNGIISANGAYFSVDNENSYCPSTCIEGQRVNCRILAQFRPNAPGIFEGKILISLPDGSYVEQSIIGISGSYTGEYLYVRPQEIDFGKTLKLHEYEQLIEIENTTDGKIPFDVTTLGEGFGISKVNCPCNDRYHHNGRYCIPDTENNPISGRPYVLYPGEKCGVVTYFFQPLTFTTSEYKGELIIDTPAKIYSVPLSAQALTNTSIPTSTPAPHINFSGGGGCNSFHSYSNVYIALSLIFLIRYLYGRKNA